ncbi:DUF3991 and TOPRIM domain-containing protein [Hespellia stercorisuis]|uniref:DUF3991 domain-containing protein n=1 Tax=Hespellia stercorisuis DSM 15480 TaxID=1121950 RepID=A0A1M6TAK4_9FIRM|nr:DUF3991 and TOPRIM domain-containing protein [Hespellia stercorisuis]SHK54025.1 Protein of unknown function [Hespellia stercorisuis DSM 15480]
MAWVSKEEIKAAGEMTAIEYLQRYQPQRLKKSSARYEWELTDHDSFKISERTSLWHWKSRDIGGLSALRFLIYVDGMPFVEAVKLLCSENPSYVPAEPVYKEKKAFVLPERYPTWNRIRQYLSGRGISNAVIKYCVEKQILYESAPYHNAVFVGVDEKQKPRYAFLRGIYDKQGKSFRIEQAGSEKTYAFCIPPEEKSVRVAVYEAAIDAMAHMTLEGGRADKYRLVLGGISAPKEGQSHRVMKKPVALEHFLKQHPEIREIELCTDNDFAGRGACEHIKKAYEGSYQMIENLPQIDGADYGDLAKQRAEQRKQCKQVERGR